jgi:Transposase DNA-binding
MTAPVSSILGFAERHFGTAALGDQRRTRRLVRAADQIVQRPDQTLPHKLGSPADLDGFYRLVNRPETTHEAVLAPHRQQTLAAMRDHGGTVLILNDGTELDYTGKKSIQTLGRIGNGSCRGYLCHNSLAVTAESGDVLGLANQILHHRADVVAGETREQRRQRADRESRLWGRGALAIGPAPDGVRWLHVCDRGGDTFEALETLQRLGGLLVRSSTSRRIRSGHDVAGPRAQLHEYAQQLPDWGRRLVTVSGRPADRKGRTRRAAQPARTARVRLAAAPVLLLPPTNRRGEHGDAPLPLWIVHVREIDPPPGALTLEWFLLTDEPVETFEDALRVQGWYEFRWIVEEFHKAQKTGCRIENPQFCTEAALQPTIALLSVVAVFLLTLRDLADRPDAKTRPAQDVLDTETVETLCYHRHGKRIVGWSIHDFVLALARLGGHQNRKSDGMPGWLTLWRGWQVLKSMMLGVQATKCRKRCGET